SIQYALDRNSQVLLEEGVLCLTPPRVGKRIGNTIRQVSDALPNVSRRLPSIMQWLRARKQQRTLEGLMIAQSQGMPFESVIISEENFMGAAFGSANRLLYPLLADQLRAIKRVFGSNISRVHICIRAYETFIPSYYAMRAVYGGRGELGSVKAWL